MIVCMLGVFGNGFVQPKSPIPIPCAAAGTPPYMEFEYSAHTPAKPLASQRCPVWGSAASASWATHSAPSCQAVLGTVVLAGRCCSSIVDRSLENVFFQKHTHWISFLFLRRSNEWCYFLTLLLSYPDQRPRLFGRSNHIHEGLLNLDLFTMNNNQPSSKIRYPCSVFFSWLLSCSFPLYFCGPIGYFLCLICSRRIYPKSNFSKVNEPTLSEVLKSKSMQCFYI